MSDTHRPTPHRDQFSIISLWIVLSAAGLGMAVIFSILLLGVLGIPRPQILLTVMHIQTFVLPLGSVCLLSYAARRNRRARNNRTPAENGPVLHEAGQLPPTGDRS